jgi:hypothetical protein
MRLRSRSETILFVVLAGVFEGLVRGREDRSVMGCPSAYRVAHRLTVGHEH